jgi:formylglycine-generating enzyme required for sulfatase activity
MGSSDADSHAFNEEKPQHTVYLDAFWIDRMEVTNAQYRKCMEAGACRQAGCWDHENYNAPDQPVGCVSWDDAQAYAAWVGGRLPTEAEWEKAARGTDGRIYPWGNSAPDCDKANYEGCVGRPATVGSYLTGASPYGAVDMAGNVWEWVADWYDEGYYAHSPARNPQGPDAGDRRVLRGGVFYSEDWGVRCANRGRFSPDGLQYNHGFRVVAAPDGL